MIIAIAVVRPDGISLTTARRFWKPDSRTGRDARTNHSNFTWIHVDRGRVRGGWQPRCSRTSRRHITQPRSSSFAERLVLHNVGGENAAKFAPLLTIEDAVAQRIHGAVCHVQRVVGVVVGEEALPAVGEQVGK